MTGNSDYVVDQRRYPIYYITSNTCAHESRPGWRSRIPDCQIIAYTGCSEAGDPTEVATHVDFSIACDGNCFNSAIPEPFTASRRKVVQRIKRGPCAGGTIPHSDLIHRNR